MAKCKVCGKDPCRQIVFLNKSLDEYTNSCETGLLMCPQCGSEGYVRVANEGVRPCPLCWRHHGEVSLAVADAYKSDVEEQIIKHVDGRTCQFPLRPTPKGQRSNARKWNTLKGDICCRVIIQFIQEFSQRNMSQTYKAVGPNVWIWGCPTEFDVLITTPEASPLPSTEIYEPEDVLACLEIKQHGLFGGRAKLKDEINKKKTQFDEVKGQYPNVECGYLTLEERSRTAKGDSINHLQETKKGLNPYPVFCLEDSDGIRKGEWARLLAWLDR